MKKTLLSTAVALGLGAASMGAHAALASNATLKFDNGVGTCLLGGTYPDGCTYGITDVPTGSWFAMDLDNNGIFDPGNKSPLVGAGPNAGFVDLNDTTTATNSHGGPPDGTENPVFDVWGFNGATGMDYLTSAAVVVGGDDGTGDGVATLDWSGWTVTWNAIPVIPMGGDTANFASDTGNATLTCQTNCSLGETYTLSYAGHVPLGDVSGFGGTFYGLFLTGTIGETTVIPIPAAVWLFGSGLIGLVGVARRKKNS